MAGFMAGFGKSLSSGIDRAVEAKQKEDEDTFKYTFQSYLDRKEKLTKKEEDQGKTARRAKEYAAMYGQDAGSARQIYEWLDSGMSDAAVVDRLENYKLVGVEEAPTPDRVDTQMKDSGMDPRTNVASSTNEDLFDKNVKRSIGRIAEITGESPDAISSTLSRQTKPPEIGDGKVGSYKLVAKDKSPDKLTDADIAARYTKLQTDVANGVEGAQNRLEVFENVTLPAYKKSKASLENPTGDNVLPDLIYQYGQAPQGSQQQRQLGERIEAFRRAAELKKGDTGDGYEQSVIFNEDGTTDLQRVKTIRDPQGNKINVIRENGEQRQVKGDVMPLSKEMRDGMAELYKARTNDIVKYEDRMVATADALRLSNDVFEIVDADDRVLTATAGAARRVTDATREVFTAVDVLKGLAEKNGAVSEQEIERALGGSIENVESKINDALGSDIADLGEKKALFDAKVLLAGFRLGGLEGQTGNGLSNQDFDRILNIVDASNDKNVFKKQWSDYVQGRIQAVDMKAEIGNQFNGAIDGFERSFGFRPIDNIVTSLSDYVTKSNDPELQKAYQEIQTYANQPITGPQTGIPKQSATPLANNPQNAPQRSDKGTERAIGKLPNGQTVYEVTLPDGTVKKVKR